MPPRRVVTSTPVAFTANGVTVGDEHHCTVWPPSTIRAWPTVKEAASEHSHTTALAISSGRPILPIGFSEITLARPPEVPPVKRPINGASIYAWQTAFHRMLHHA